MRFKLRKRFFGFKVSPKRRLFFPVGILLCLFFLMIIGGFYFVDEKIRPTLHYLAETQAKQMAIQAINDSVSSNISANIRYQDIIAVHFDRNGKVALMQPNTGEINRISASATLAVQNSFKNLKHQVITIPMGQILGLRLLSGWGPDLPVKIFPIGIVESAIHDTFDVAGINQIRHRIFITVKTTIKMVVPLVDQETGVSSTILLTEAIVMGQVPDVYVGGGGGGIILSKNIHHATGR